MGGLLRLLLFAIALWLLLSGLRRLRFPPTLPRRGKETEKEPQGVFLVKDPQCGRFVSERDPLRVSFRGQELYFCSLKCHDL